MKLRRALAAVCFVLTVTVTSVADDSQRVGPLGLRSALRIEGAKTFAPDEICDELLNELEVVAACDEDAPLDALTALIAEKIVAGYKYRGFADVKVVVALDDGRMKAAIEEGDRYTQGEVEVIACGALGADRLRRELTEPKDGKPALWSGDEPASFNAEYQAWLASRVAEWAGDQGYYRAKLKVAVEPDRQKKKATLKVKVIDEGPCTTVTDFEFNQIRDLEQLFPYLGVDVHASLTRPLRDQISQRLLRSGRFARIQWELGEPEKRDDLWRPKLSLQEYELSPPLGGSLTREEEALLKLAEWVQRFGEGDEELLIRFPNENVSIVFAPRHGFIITLDAPREAGGGFLSALVVAEERVGLYSMSQRRKIDAAPPPTPIMGNCEVLLVDGHPKWDGRGRFSAGLGMRTPTSKTGRRHVNMQLKLTAAAALSVVRTHRAKSSWDGDMVSFEWRNRRLRVNSLTGQLLEQVVGVVPDTDANVPDDSWTPHMTLEHGHFARRLAEIEGIAAGWPNDADAQRPLSCFGQFICEELQQLDVDSKSAHLALRKLIAFGLLRPLDELICHVGRSQDDSFTIPQPYSHSDSFDDLLPLARSLARACGMRVGNHLFPREGWMQQMWRDGVVLLADGRVQASDDLSRQPANACGPICALLSAQMLNAAGLDALSPVCARRGLRRLSLASFHDDCRELLSGEGLLSECLLRAAATLRQLDADEVKALAELLSRFDLLDSTQAAVFEQTVLAMRTSGDRAPSQAAADSLDAVWRAGLSNWVAERLNELATPPTPRHAPFAYQGASTNAAAVGGFDYDSLSNFTPGNTLSPPANVAPAYGPASPTTALPLQLADRDSPPDAAKPLAEEVRELKWLAQAIAKRLEVLEERLHSQPEAIVEPSPVEPAGRLSNRPR